MEPITTSLLILVLGNVAQNIIRGACEDYLKDKLKGLFAKAAKLGAKDDLQVAYESAMQQAYETCLEVFLRNIETFSGKRSELKHYAKPLKAFIKDPAVAGELLRSVQDPNDATAPSVGVLEARWQALGGRVLPSDDVWAFTAKAYRSQALQQSLLSEPLRAILLGRNVDRLLKEVQRQGGVAVSIRRDQYSKRMRAKFSPVDLANLMPAYAEDPGRMVIRDVFVPQDVRENPPPVEIPKDFGKGRGKGGRGKRGGEDEEAHEAREFEKLRSSYVSQSPKPVFDVIAATGNFGIRGTAFRVWPDCVLEVPGRFRALPGSCGGGSS